MQFENIFTCAVDTYFLIHADKAYNPLKKQKQKTNPSAW